VTVRKMRPRSATVLAASALGVAVIAAVLAFEQPASATSRITVGPYVADVTAHDVTGDAIHLAAGEVKSATVECPKGQVLVSGGFEAQGTIAKLGSVVSITSSHPEGSFTYKVPGSSGVAAVETEGPRDWKVTAVDPGLAQNVDVQPWASCLELKVLVTVTASSH
jgi:hypothetical protein